MKLNARDIDGFIKYPQKYAGALIYGLDEGQVRARVRELCANWMGPDADAINRIEFSADQIAADPARLSDELASFSLLGGKRAICIREAGDDLLPLLDDALATRAKDNFLILYTHDSLSSGSKLRAFCERVPEIAAVACYKDEGANLSQLIRDTLRAYGLRVQNDVVNYLSQQLQGDRQVVLNELEKISLYIGDEAEEVDMETAVFLTADSRESSLDELAHAVAAGQPAIICSLTDTLMNEGVQPVVAVRALMRYLRRLEAVAQARHNGASLDQAIDQLKPPVFFKHKAQLRSHATRWGLSRVNDALALLHHLELITKREGRLARPLLAQGLLDVADLANPHHKAA